MQMNRHLIKLFVLELLQWAACACPVFVTGAELGRVLDLKGQASYWLIVSVSIGYQAVVTLLLWLPVKILFQWYKKLDWKNDEW